MKLAGPSPPFNLNCLSVFNILEQKSKQNQHILIINTRDRQYDNSTSIYWQSTVTLDGDMICEGAIDQIKKQSQSKAVLLFFKTLFPEGFTWLDVVAFIKDKKRPIDDVLKLR